MWSQQHRKYVFALSSVFCLVFFTAAYLYGWKWMMHLNIRITKTENFRLTIERNLDANTPGVCIVARIYGAQISYFPVLALSLRHAIVGNSRIYAVNTDNRTDIQYLARTIRFINEYVGQNDYVVIPDIGAPCVDISYGYCMTDRMLDYLYKQNPPHSNMCTYVIFTNGDNFYTRNLGTRILPHMKAHKDIIVWSFVSHHYNPPEIRSTSEGKPIGYEIVDSGTERCITGALKVGKADLGAVAYRFEFLRKNRLYFQSTNGRYAFGSDGYFLEKAAKLTNSSVVLRQTLFFHQ